MYSLELFQKLFPKTKAEVLNRYVEPLNQAAGMYYILDTTTRAAAFIAQVGHESGGFNFVKENLNYSADGLLKVFPKYFPNRQLAEQYQRNPQMIANRVYGGRMGNGPEATGDGYKFCGRGLIQLTGKNNYQRMATDFQCSLDECVAYLETPVGACYSAAWFWDVNLLNDLCDKGDFTTLTKRINGGTIGLQDRMHHYQLALQLIG